MGSWSLTPTAELSGDCVGGELVPGDATSIRSAAERFGRVADGAERVSGLLRRVDAGEWTGEAGMAFREVAGSMPAPYARAAECFGEAAQALGELATALEHGQAVARRQQDAFLFADSVSRRWRMEVQAWQASDPLVQGPPPPTSDPGDWGREAARQQVRVVQEEVARCAERAERVLRDCADRAPHDNEWGRFGRGVVSGATSPFTTAWGLTLSEDRTENWTGVWQAATHPVDTLRAAGQAVADDPAGAAGAMLPAALLGLGAARLTDLDIPTVYAHADPPATGPRRGVDRTPTPGRPETRPAGRPSWEWNPRLRDPLWVRRRAELIVRDHAWKDHGIGHGHFSWAHGNPQLLVEHVIQVMNKPSEIYSAIRDRTFFWDDERQIIIVLDERKAGTVFEPDDGRAKLDTWITADLQERRDAAAAEARRRGAGR